MSGHRWLAVLALSLAACAAPADDDADESLGALGSSRPYRPQMADASAWTWHTRDASVDACTPSAPAQAAADAAVRARKSTFLPPELVLTTRNAAGPSFLSAGEMFPALAALIAEAEHEVDLQFAMNDHDSDPFNDVIGGLHVLYQRLAADAARGVTRSHPVMVRIVVPNWFGSGNVQKIATSIRARLGAVDPALLRLEIGALRQVALGIMHVKVAIIDGITVHVGGGNLTHHQNYQDGAPHEQDSAYVVKGAVGKAALAQFDDVWNSAANTVHTCDADRCSQVRRKTALAVSVSGRAGSGHVPEVADPDLAAAGVPETACLPMVFMVRRANNNPFARETDNPIGQGFRAAFRSSRSVLRVSTPNLNGKWAEAIEQIVKANETQVRLILPQTFNDLMERDPFIGGGTNRRTMAWLHRRLGADAIGVDQPLDARWFSVDGTTIQRGGWKTGGRHIKYYSVDGQLAIVGSTNLDKQSMSRAREIGIAVDDPTVTAQWDAKVFDADFARAISVDGRALPAAPDETPEDELENAPPETQQAYGEL
jgi:phosphatidylserine/phosphatidylglycerophosphate/cardiolipin synthase-like enzyme